jgi:hypothetical protein
MLAAVTANAPRARAARTPLRTRMLAMVSPKFGLIRTVPEGIIALEGSDVNLRLDGVVDFRNLIG